MGRTTQSCRSLAQPSARTPVSCRLAGLVALALLAAAPAAHADSVSTSSGNGFARIVFVLDPVAHARSAMGDGVLTVAFDRKIAIDPDALAQGLSAYISSVRSDPDGQTFRLALAQSARLHTSTSGNRIAIDLAPQTFAGTPPDLPPPPPRQATAVDVAKLNALPIRAGAYANFTRLVFDWPKNVPYAVFPGAANITIRFEAMVRPDFASFEHVSPPWVKEAGVARREQRHRHRIPDGCVFGLSRFPRRQQNRSRHPRAEIGCPGLQPARHGKGDQAQDYEARRQQRRDSCASQCDCGYGCKTETRQCTFANDGQTAGISGAIAGNSGAIFCRRHGSRHDAVRIIHAIGADRRRIGRYRTWRHAAASRIGQRSPGTTHA
jgi:hypothetical protein